MFGIPKKELRRNRRAIQLRGNCRISNICGRLLSIRGKHSNGVTYSLLVYSVAAINIIKRNDVPKEVRELPMKKYFVMGKDKNYSYDATYINYFGKKHPFHCNLILNFYAIQHPFGTEPPPVCLRISKQTTLHEIPQNNFRWAPDRQGHLSSIKLKDTKNGGRKRQV